jgi:hypothetical protein
MFRRLSLAVVALLLAAPLAAQAPAGYMMRIDASTDAADPDDSPDVKITTVGSGFQVNTGPAVVLYNPASTATGQYTLKATFTLQQPSSHQNYYGLVFGGQNLNAANQSYVYFLVAQTGRFIIKHRANNDAVHDVQPGTMHDAVVRPDASGKSVNTLEVRVGASDIQYVVNGQVVHTTPKSGMTARTDGVYGVRINHVLPGVLVVGLTVTQGR